MDDVQIRILSFIARSVSRVSKVLNLGAGGTWPGEIAMRIDRNILSKLQKRVRKGIILIAGTNGKTTTSTMLERILAAQGDIVLHNASGANLENGLVSALLLSDTVDWAVFEVDEAAFPNVLNTIHPRVVVLLNLFRDQLDRYGEVDAVADSWEASLMQLSGKTTVVINADDPHLATLGSKAGAETKYFGLGSKKYFRETMQHATDTTHCPSCGARLTFQGVYFSHLGMYACSVCDFRQPTLDLRASQVNSPLEGTYNIYNTLAATLAGQSIGIAKKRIHTALKGFTPAFGRLEELTYRGKRVKVLLSKNPTGFNESLKTVIDAKYNGPLVILLNDRIPDGRDVSWIWDVDFEVLEGYKKPIYVSGDRVYDMALRLKYAEISKKQEARTKKRSSEPASKSIEIIEDVRQAIDTATSETKKEETMWILATYSAMLEARKVLTGRKIL